MIDKVKRLGQVFTPKNIVSQMLDLYKTSLLEKYILEPSCGDGAFLCAIVERYIKEFLAKNKDLNQLKVELETFIYGIEIDNEIISKAKQRLDEIAKKYELYNIKWKLICADTLQAYKNINLKFDLIIGNPPYVRVHNLAKLDDFKCFSFAKTGMIDLYLIFFEIAFSLLSNKGKLIFITPSSWLNSTAGKALRKYILNNQNLEEIIDLGHFKAFFKISTYTAISVFNKTKNTQIKFKKYGFDNFKNISYDDLFLKSEKIEIFLGNLEYKKILESNSNIKIKNGFATLCDKVFIGNFDFKHFCIPVIKGSTLAQSSCIFPYDEKLNLISLSTIKELEPRLFDHIMKNEKALKNKDNENPEFWWGFGRLQALSDVYKPKIVFNTLIKDIKDIKIAKVLAGQGVYSGLYLAGDYDLEKIKEILLNDDFLSYVYSIGKYKSGGYYTFSSTDLSKYLGYKLKEYQYEPELFKYAN